MSIPATWPPGNSGLSANFPCLVIDEGSYIKEDVELGIRTEASIVVRVEGLPDTDEAVCLAVEAAKAAYPTHPCRDCLILSGAGNAIGHPRLNGDSMIVGRGRTTDPGFTTDGGLQTGTTGTIVLVKLIYTLPSKTTTL